MHACELHSPPIFALSDWNSLSVSWPLDSPEYQCKGHELIIIVLRMLDQPEKFNLKHHSLQALIFHLENI